MEELRVCDARQPAEDVSNVLFTLTLSVWFTNYSALPLCVLIRRVTSFRGEPTLHWRSTRSIEIAMQPVLLQHNCGRTAFPFESCRSSRLAASNWVLGCGGPTVTSGPRDSAKVGYYDRIGRFKFPN